MGAQEKKVHFSSGKWSEGITVMTLSRDHFAARRRFYENVSPRKIWWHLFLALPFLLAPQPITQRMPTMCTKKQFWGKAVKPARET